MPGMDRDLLLESLSALTDCTVRPSTERKQSHVSGSELTTENLLQVVLLGTTLFKDALSSLSSWMSSWSVTDNQTRGNSQNSDFSENEFFVDMDNFLEPRYDFDFRNFSGTADCSRGGESYRRPVGWYRFALKVKDKYPDGNAWLGSVHWRRHSEAGEWPVSFHGTSIQDAKGIARSYYRAGDRMAYGRGIYSTPDIKIAEVYAFSKKFTSKKTGKDYEVIMQNRINPNKRKIISEKNFWLIPVPEGSPEEQQKQIVESSIRPYGILIKEVTQ